MLVRMVLPYGSVKQNCISSMEEEADLESSLCLCGREEKSEKNHRNRLRPYNTFLHKISEFFEDPWDPPYL